MIALTAFALALTLSPQQPPKDANEVSPAIIESHRGGPWGGAVPSDLEIARQLRVMLETQPDRVICMRVTRGESRLPHEVCKTLRGWYDFESARATRDQIRDVIAVLDHMPRAGDSIGARLGSPPYELVDMIKDRYRDPRSRALAVERAKARKSGSPSDPQVSNP